MTTNPTRFPHLDEFFRFLEAHNAESDRGAVLMACSFLENQLGEIIRAFLREGEDGKSLLNGRFAPLSSFAARCELAKALGLISAEEFHDIEILRKIRNDFAHDYAASFALQSVGDRCKNLKFAAREHNVEEDPRGLFSSAAICVILNLTNRPAYVGRERCEAREWPY